MLLYEMLTGTLPFDGRSVNNVVPLPKLSGISADAPAFLPDGKWIAYSEDGSRYLWRSKADGTDAIPLTSTPLFQGHLPAWSPDGTQISFMGTARDGGVPKPLVPDSLWPLAPQSSEHWQGGPAWSPDGKQIAFGENGDHFPLSPACAIHIFHLDTQLLSTIPHSEGLWSARWSPVGRYLAALTRDDEKLMLYDFRRQTWTLLDDGVIGDNPGGEPERVADLSILDPAPG